MIDFTKIRPGMMVACGGHSLTSRIIRVVSLGRKHWSNENVVTHVGVTIEIKGRYFIAESVGSDFPHGLRISSFGKYLNSRHKYILDVLDCPKFRAVDRLAIEQQIATDLDHVMEYDYKGLIAFVTDRVKQDRKRVYCSEYVYQLTGKYIDYPESFSKRVSPHELSVYNQGWQTVKGAVV